MLVQSEFDICIVIGELSQKVMFFQAIGEKEFDDNDYLVQKGWINTMKSLIEDLCGLLGEAITDDKYATILNKIYYALKGYKDSIQSLNEIKKINDFDILDDIIDEAEIDIKYLKNAFSEYKSIFENNGGEEKDDRE